jgi:hypothetical protein
MKKKGFFKTYQGTLIMAVLALGLGAFAFFEYQRGQSEQVQLEKSKMLLGWENESEYQSALLELNGKTFEVNRENGVWRVIQPVKDLGDEFNVEAWLSDIGAEKAQKIEPKRNAGGEVQWAEYGLDKNLTRLVIKKTSGEQAELFFANLNAYDGSFFIRYNGEVYVGEKTWSSILSRDPKHLRSRSVYRINQNPTRISFDYGRGKKSFALKSENSEWKFESRHWPLAKSNVETWLADLKKIAVVEFVDSVAKDSDYGLDAPVVRWELEFPDQKRQTWTIGRKMKSDQPQYFFRISDEAAVFQVDAAFAERVFAHEHYFREGQAPFQLEIEKISKFEWEQGAQKVVLKKSDAGTWELIEGPKGHSFSAEQWERFLQKVKDLNADVFLSKSEVKGLTKPFLRMRLLDASGGLVKEMAFGSEFTSDETLPRNNPLVYATVTGDDEALGIRKEVISGLSLEQLLAKEGQTQSPHEDHNH